MAQSRSHPALGVVAGERGEVDALDGALTSQAACHSFFTVRRSGSVAARRSTAERLTRTAATGSGSNGHAGIVRMLGQRIRQVMDGGGFAGGSG